MSIYRKYILRTPTSEEIISKMRDRAPDKLNRKNITFIMGVIRTVCAVIIVIKLVF